MQIGANVAPRFGFFSPPFSLEKRLIIIIYSDSWRFFKKISSFARSFVITRARRCLGFRLNRLSFTRYTLESLRLLCDRAPRCYSRCQNASSCMDPLPHVRHSRLFKKILWGTLEVRYPTSVFFSLFFSSLVVSSHLSPSTLSLSPPPPPPPPPPPRQRTILGWAAGMRCAAPSRGAVPSSTYPTSTSISSLATPPAAVSQ